MTNTDPMATWGEAHVVPGRLDVLSVPNAIAASFGVNGIEFAPCRFRGRKASDSRAADTGTAHRVSFRPHLTTYTKFFACDEFNTAVLEKKTFGLCNLV
jgi:hypothetical protein